MEGIHGVFPVLQPVPGDDFDVGIGSTQNLAAELFKSAVGLNFQVVPYKNTGEVVMAAKSGDAALIFEILAPMTSHIKSGNLRALAVTGANRFPALPDVPTAIEQGAAGYDAVSWNGLAAPAKTPRQLIERINAEVVRAVASPDVQKRFAELGIEGRTSTPEQLKDFYASEAARWSQVIRSSTNTPAR